VEDPPPRSRKELSRVGPLEWEIDLEELQELIATRKPQLLRTRSTAARAQRSSEASPDVLARLMALEAVVEQLREHSPWLFGESRVAGDASVARGEPILAVQQPEDGDEHIQPQNRPVARRARIPTRPINSSDTLPSHLVSWRGFANLHEVSPTTVQNAIKDGRLAVIRGRWKRGKNWVEGALDANGRHEFVRLWGDRPEEGFRRCPECPHDLPSALGSADVGEEATRPLPVTVPHRRTESGSLSS
jgi:hypothetical protein